MNLSGFLLWGLGGIAASLAIAATLAGAAGFAARRREAEATGPAWGAAAGLGLAYVVGHAMVREWLIANRRAEASEAFRLWWSDGGICPLFPADASDWLPWLVGAATVLGLLDGARPAPGWARWENRILLTAATLWLLLGPLWSETWEPAQGAAWTSGLGAGMLLIWSVLDARSVRLGASIATVLLTMAVGLAIVLALSGSAVFALLGGVLAAGVGGLWLVGWPHRRMRLSRGAIPAFVVAYTGLIFSGLFYAETTRTSALALALPPLASYIDRLSGFSGSRSWKQAAVRLAAIIVPVGVAVVAQALWGPYAREDASGY